MPWDFALILAVMAVLVSWRSAVQVRKLLAQPQISSADRLAIYATTIAFQWGVSAVVAWRCYARGVSLADLGLALPDAKLTAVAGLGLCVLATGIQLGGLRQLARRLPSEQGFVGELARKLLPQEGIEALAFVGLVVTVALCEEFLYRGFAFAAIERATGGSQLAASLGSSALFAVAHLYQGRRGLVTTFVVGVVFAEVRMWTGSLLAPMAAHLVTDLVAGLLAPRMLRGGPAVRDETAQ
jgi:membrane protease YdiL (CAAX protease family)